MTARSRPPSERNAPSFQAMNSKVDADVPPEIVARFSAMYYVLWQMAVAISFGLASALLAVLSGASPGHRYRTSTRPFSSWD